MIATAEITNPQLLRREPIDQLNPAISIRADYGHLQDREFGIPAGATNPPLGVGTGPRGLELLEAHVELISPVGISTSELTTTFTWSTPAQWNSTIYVSVHPPGEGLWPDDTPESLSDEFSVNGDGNHMRIVTKNCYYRQHVHIGRSASLNCGANVLLGNRSHIAWRTGASQEHAFQTDLGTTSSNFTSVTVINHGFEIDFGDIDFTNNDESAAFLALAQLISERGGGGNVLYYNPAGQPGATTLDKQLWINPIAGQTWELGKPLVLVGNWLKESDIDDSGFAEAAADAIYASLFELHKETGEKLLQAPLHFIGHGRGAVVNSESSNESASISQPWRVSTLRRSIHTISQKSLEDRWDRAAPKRSHFSGWHGWRSSQTRQTRVKSGQVSGVPRSCPGHRYHGHWQGGLGQFQRPGDPSLEQCGLLRQLLPNGCRGRR